MSKWILFILGLFAISNLYAAVFYIEPKAYLDVAKGEMVSGKIIGIENGIIKSITDEKPKNAIVRTYKNFYIMPGLIDCHTHLFVTQTLKDKTFENAIVREEKNSNEFRLNRAKIFLKQYLNEGFTSICDLGNSGNFLDVTLKNKIMKDEKYPELFVSGKGIATFNGQFSPNTSKALVKKEYTLVNDKSDVELVLSAYIKKKVDILKVYIDNSPGIGEMNLSLIKKIVESEKSRYFKKITFHALEKKSTTILGDLPSVSFEHGSNSILAKSRSTQEVFLTLTDLPLETLREFKYYNKSLYQFQLYRAKKAYENNIILIFGPDFYFHKLDKNFNRAQYVKKSIASWISSGIPNIEILRAMTLNPARSLKENKFLGVIQVGARANLIGLKGNPLEDLEALKLVDLVINKGKIVKSPKLFSKK
jgi:imidazolonepropionase-like amidohydrolase